MRRNLSRWILIAVIGVCTLTTGCSSPNIQGMVMEGRRSGVFLVEPDDPRLSEPGIADASIEVTLDPASLRPSRLGKKFANTNGKFSVAVDAVGAGFLEYDIGFYVRSAGFTPVDTGAMALPPSGKRLLIIMVPGIDKPSPSENLLDESRRESERWNVK